MTRLVYHIGPTRYIKLVAEKPVENLAIRDLILVVPWVECHASGGHDSESEAIAPFGSIDFKDGVQP